MENRKVTRLDAILIAGLLVCILILCLYRLETYPAPWFDEGLNCQAAKNIALYSQYGLRSADGFVRFHPAIQTGPTVLLPIALVLRLSGASVLRARLVTVFYAVLALVVFYILVCQMCNRKVAFLASLLLIFSFDHEFTAFVSMGRQVLGEVPALAFFWLGTLLWFRTWKSTSRLALIWPGLCWGLTFLTKVQFALVLPVALGLFWLFDRISNRKLQIHHILVPALISGLCVLVWYGYQIRFLGFTGFWQQTTSLASAGGTHFLSFSFRRMTRAVFQLLDSTLFLFGVPGMLSIVGSSVQNREEGECQQAFMVMFAAAWLGWYVFLSIGWMRYAFVPTAISAIFSARLLGDLWDWASQRHQVLDRGLSLTPGQIAVGGMIAALLLSGLVPLVKRIAQSPDSGLQDLAQYLNSHVPTDVVIESWEWEVDLLTNHIYHHPPYEVTNAFTELVWGGTPVPQGLYDPLAFRPTYLINGSFAKWTGLYSPDFLKQECTLVTSIGEYDLYKVNVSEGK